MEAIYVICHRKFGWLENTTRLLRGWELLNPLILLIQGIGTIFIILSQEYQQFESLQESNLFQTLLRYLEQEVVNTSKLEMRCLLCWQEL